MTREYCTIVQKFDDDYYLIEQNGKTLTVQFSGIEQYDEYNEGDKISFSMMFPAYFILIDVKREKDVKNTRISKK